MALQKLNNHKIKKWNGKTEVICGHLATRELTKQNINLKSNKSNGT